MMSRDLIEQRLAGRLGSELTAELRAILQAMGDPPDVEKVEAAKWDEFGSAIASLLAVSLMDAYLMAAEAAIIGIPDLAMDMVTIHEAAARWSAEYSFSLAKELTTTRQAYVRAEVERFFRLGNMTISDLRHRLSPMFDAVAAERIAITETTTAWTAGNRQVYNTLEAYGLRHRLRWATARDEKVCPICELLDGVYNEGGSYLHPKTGQLYFSPPAHVNCRCEENGEIVA